MRNNEYCERIVEVAKRAVVAGLVQERAGNFSICDRQNNVVYVTPAGVHREVLMPDQVVVVDLENRQLSGNGKPSSETLMHLEIYKARPDVNGVVHTHSRYATAFAVANKAIEPWVVESVFLGGRIEVAPYAKPGTRELALSAVRGLGDKKAVLLQNHGVTCVGAELEEAFLNAVYVEDVAQICYLAMQLGKPTPVPEEDLADLMARGRK